MSDTYKTIAEPAEGQFKEKGSRFLSYIFPVLNEEDIKEILQTIKKEHHSARHHCYAWRLGISDIRFRVNDDGEPSSTAGKPILGQLVSHDITNVLLVVIRYFGGTLLGVSGLINAYRESASDAVLHAKIITNIIDCEYLLNFSYNELSAVMQIIKMENLTQTAIQLTETCELQFVVRKADADRVTELFRKIYGVRIARL